MKNHEELSSDAAPTIGDRLLTLREAAEVLHLSTRTVREYVPRGSKLAHENQPTATK